MINNILLKKVEYKYAISTSFFVHIGYGVDNNFMRGMMTSIVSFCLNNEKINFCFHIITNNISEKNKIRLKQIAKQYKINISIYIIDINTFKNFPVFVHLPISMYFRFILPILLTNVNKLFYIDADIICIKKANDLFNINLEENIIGAIPDQNDERNDILGLKNHVYFNSGMLVINVNKWNEIKFLEIATKLVMNNYKLFKFPDQDILNIILSHKVKYLDTIFNCFVDYRNCRTSIKNEDIVLLHFSALPKPWNIAWSISKVSNKFNRNLYAYYEEKTPWKNIPLSKPKTYKEISAYIKGLYNNKKYLKLFIWLLKYILVRVEYQLKK